MFSTIKDIMQWSKGYKRQIYVGFFYSFVASMLAALPFWLASKAVIFAYKNINNNNFAHFKPVFILFIALALCCGLRFLFLYLKAKSQESIGFQIAADMRLEIAEKLKKTSMGYFSENNVGSLLNAVTTELSMLELQSTKMIDVIINGYINFVVLCLFMLAIDWRAGVVIFIVGLLGTLIIEQINKKSRQNSDIANHIQTKMANNVVEFIRGINVAKTYGLESTVLDGLRSVFGQSKRIRLKIQAKFVSINSVLLLLLDSATVVTILICVCNQQDNQLSLNFFVTLVFFSYVLFNSIKEMPDATHILGAIDDNLHHLKQLDKMPLIDMAGADLKINQYGVEFKKVGFGYEKEKVLHDVSVVIPENKTTAIIGPSGSGKSTLCKLIARFYDCDEGEVLVGGHDVREFSYSSLIKNISIVFQKPYLFHDTIKNNILFGKTDADMAEVLRASKKACCHDFIMQLPQKYDTVLDEGGNSLSGGQKQRLSIARAILKDAPIIILDEAMASVDPENEWILQQAIASLVFNKTIITIAHRLSTIQNADQILVMDAGRIVQKGNHRELMAEPGIYRDFVNIKEKAKNWQL
ncbi:ABC transporter ATP-binding protein [Liquorilactobacillus uvarum]|uniref:ABC transporter ATP-binding protein n=1 Tax=Liquorilactobacillus uvarum TaxID=303240 RepID=UPI000710EB9A|nr:ABC transporter ATP-binding protein [Liquorilactobacillus uvarum]